MATVGVDDSRLHMKELTIHVGWQSLRVRSHFTLFYRVGQEKTGSLDRAIANDGSLCLSVGPSVTLVSHA